MSKYCAIVKDLIWQYAEGECSPETKEFIEEHIKECEDCRKLFEDIKKTEELVSETVNIEPIQSEKVLKKGFKKIRKRFVVTTVALILLVPIILSSFLIKNELDKEGICFSNIDEIKLARAFANYIEKGQYEKAAKYLDFTKDYRDIMNAKEELGTTWYDDAVVVDKNDDVYAISGNFAKILDRAGYTDWRTNFNEKQFWSVIMMNFPTEAFIPEHIWNELVTEYYQMADLEENSIIPGKINGIECDRVWFFYRHETEYGVYYSVNSPLIGAELTFNAPMIIGSSAVVSKEVYDDAKSYIEDNAEKAKENFLEFYEKELKMTCKEYNEHRREDFVKRMKLYNERGYKFEYNKVKDIYKKDVWIVEISCIERFTEREEEVERRYSIELRIAGGEIIDVNSSAEMTYLFDEILGRARIEE